MAAEVAAMSHQNWETKLTATYDDEEYPWGWNRQAIEGHRHLDSSFGDDDYRLDQLVRVVPGIVEWDDSCAFVWKDYHWHNWDINQFNDRSLVAYEPGGQLCGTETHTFGIDKGGPYFEWTYSQDGVCTDDNSSGETYDLYIEYATDSDTASSSHQRDHRSVMLSDGAPYCDEWDIAKSTIWSEFIDQYCKNESSPFIGQNVTWYGNRCPP